MSSFLPTSLFGRRPHKPSSQQTEHSRDDGPGYPVQESWTVQDSKSWSIRFDSKKRPYWFNEETGQWFYQVMDPSGKPPHVDIPSLTGTAVSNQQTGQWVHPSEKPPVILQPQNTIQTPVGMPHPLLVSPANAVIYRQPTPWDMMLPPPEPRR